MRQSLTLDHVSDGVVARNARAVELVNRNASLVNRNADALESDVFDVRTHPDGTQNHVAVYYMLALRVRVGDFTALAFGIDRLNLGTRDNIDALLLEYLL